MSKITLNSIASLDAINAAATVNANMVTIQNAFDNNLSRDGTSPNQMSSNLDMNSFRLLNLPTPASGTDPLRVQDLSSYVVTTANQITVPTVTTVGAVPYYNATNGLTLGTDSLHTWDSVNHRLGIGTATPSQALQVVGNITTSGTVSLTGATQQFIVSTAGSSNGFLLTNNSAATYFALSSGNNGHYTIFGAPSGVAFFQARDADNSGGDANWGYMNNDTLQITNRANNVNFAKFSSVGLQVQSGGLFQTNNASTAGAINIFTGVQTSPNAGDTNDSVLNLSYSLTAASATNELVARVMNFSAANRLTGGGHVNNMRCFDLAMGTFAGAVSDNLVGIYIENLSSAGTTTNVFGVQVASLPTNTTSWAFSDEASNQGIRTISNVIAQSSTAVPAGGSVGKGIMMSSTANLGIFFGSGVPTLSAAKGSFYIRTDGSSTTTRGYINTDGSTTWTAITTVA